MKNVMKISSFILMILLFIGVSKITVKADVVGASRATVEVNVKADSVDNYGIGFLSNTAQWFGPGAHYDEDIIIIDGLPKCNEEVSKYKKMIVECVDDGYFYVGLYNEKSGSAQINWGYYPPEEFKIAIAINDKVYTSDVIILGDNDEITVVDVKIENNNVIFTDSYHSKSNCSFFSNFFIINILSLISLTVLIVGKKK